MAVPLVSGTKESREKTSRYCVGLKPLFGWQTINIVPRDHTCAWIGSGNDSGKPLCYIGETERVMIQAAHMAQNTPTGD